MKKNCIAIFLSIFLLLFTVTVPTSASEEYESYNEIMLSTGKLLENFTDEEYKEYYKSVKKTTFWGVNVFTVNKSIPVTYISSTLYSVENRGMSDISYELDVVVETTQKTTWKVSGGVNGTGKGSISKFKTDIAAKAGIDYSSVQTSSKKETQKMKITIEKQSRAIVYLMGSAKITNGVCACYIFFVNIGSAGFEYFTLVNQYPRMEKRSI